MMREDPVRRLLTAGLQRMTGHRGQNKGNSERWPFAVSKKNKTRKKHVEPKCFQIFCEVRIFFNQTKGEGQVKMDLGWQDKPDLT